MMLLSDILSDLKIKRVVGDASVPITGLFMDSRKVIPGGMFVVLSEPDLQDRTQFIPFAERAGAQSILVDHEISDTKAVQVIVPDVAVASAVLASAFYEYPTRRLPLIGITGTKGKTSTSYFITQLLRDWGMNIGTIGTTGAIIGDEVLEPTNSTPHAINLQRIFRTLLDKGAQAIAMEVSSHALKLHRTAGCEFRVGVFTNIGHDHMDFHKSMDDYVHSKARLMTKIINGVAVINIDDEYGQYMKSLAASEVVTYGTSVDALLRATNIEYTDEGTRFTLTCPEGAFMVSTRLSGLFNVYNVLAAIGTAYAMGMPVDRAVQAAGRLGGVPGRVEAVDTGSRGFKVVVDYAHTPESLENVLSTLKSMNPHRLITVFGCGGDRDRTKRPVMGDISARYSDYTIVTSDNPRTEEPNSIIQEIKQGLVDGGYSTSIYELEVDRRKAIYTAISMAEPGDIVAICGKGHETGQIIGSEKLPFDDREVALDAMKAVRE